MCAFWGSDDTREIVAAILWDGDGSVQGLCARLGLGHTVEIAAAILYTRDTSKFTSGSALGLAWAFSLAAPGLLSMMVHNVIVKTVVLVGLIGLHNTGCSGGTRLALHIPSSS